VIELCYNQNVDLYIILRRNIYNLYCELFSKEKHGSEFRLTYNYMDALRMLCFSFITQTEDEICCIPSSVIFLLSVYCWFWQALKEETLNSHPVYPFNSSL
jgi:hypothetical protein